MFLAGGATPIYHLLPVLIWGGGGGLHSGGVESNCKKLRKNCGKVAENCGKLRENCGKIAMS